MSKYLSIQSFHGIPDMKFDTEIGLIDFLQT